MEEIEKTYNAYLPYLKHQASWPLVIVKAPRLIAVPGVSQKSTGISLRLPVALDSTVDVHCRMVGASKSDWLRRAIIHLLSVEQQTLKEISVGIQA